MLTRRDMVKLGLAGAALPLVSGKAALAAATNAPALYKLVYDQSIPASLAFGEQARKLGAPVAAIQGDVTALWFDDLHFMWKRSRDSVAGLTRPSSLFALEQMAHLAGRRVVFRTEHITGADGSIRHRVATAQGFQPLSNRSANWPQQMAAAMIDRLAPVANHMQAQKMLAAPARDHDTLVSWIIAAA